MPGEEYRRAKPTGWHFFVSFGSRCGYIPRTKKL